MPMPWSADLAGRIDEHVISSDLLRGNPLGDPYERPLLVYLPPGYDDDPARRYPAVYVIQGYTGHVAMWDNRSAFRLTTPEAVDGLFASGKADLRCSQKDRAEGGHFQSPIKQCAFRLNWHLSKWANSTSQPSVLAAVEFVRRAVLS